MQSDKDFQGDHNKNDCKVERMATPTGISKTTTCLSMFLKLLTKEFDDDWQLDFSFQLLECMPMYYLPVHNIPTGSIYYIQYCVITANSNTGGGDKKRQTKC